MKQLVMLAAGLGMAASLTACGGDDDTDATNDFAGQKGEAIAEAAKTDMGDLKSARVNGSITTDGQAIDLDLQLNSEGDCTGSIGVDGGKAELLGVGGQTWMRPDEAFWSAFAGDSADQLVSLVGDKWVVVPSDSESFNEFCDLDGLLEQMLDGKDESDSTYTTGDTSEIDGDEVVAVDNKDDEGTSTGYVLVDSPHYLVKVEKTEGADSGSVSFSDFDADVDVEAPADDEAIDLDSLGG